ncbi:hypothetical protein COL91_12495 [Bacillus pseudomycoides]|nr:hypothetical protein COO02_05830 [Bacillus pseudomycoides]PGA90922.1 hypothetical protein COL91_12495 [Bacillus pseudomycoides]
MYEQDPRQCSLAGLGGSVRVRPTLLTPWVFSLRPFFSYFHNNTNFPIFGHGVIRQILRKFEKRYISTFLMFHGLKYAIMHFRFERPHMNILPLIR